MIFTFDNVTKIEIGLINACVLNCPMCLRLEDHVISLKPGVALQYDKVLEVLGVFKNLETVDLIGSISEPLLYPRILDLVKYIKGRGASVRIGTNANVHKEQFWKDLGEVLDHKDIVRFAIDGSTQEIHQKYRVGGNLQKVLDNHRTLKASSSAITILQHLVFEHNRDDFKNIEKIFLENNFNIIEKIESGEPAYLSDENIDQVMPRKELVQRYRETELKLKSIKLEKFDCFARLQGQMYLNHLGQLLPCDDLEELAFESVRNKDDSFPDIYKNKLEDCLSFANEFVKKRFLSEVCKRCCSKDIMALKKQYPVLQSADTLNYHPLTIFRGVVSVK